MLPTLIAPLVGHPSLHAHLVFRPQTTTAHPPLTHFPTHHHLPGLGWLGCLSVLPGMAGLPGWLVWWRGIADGRQADMVAWCQGVAWWLGFEAALLQCSLVALRQGGMGQGNWF